MVTVTLLFVVVSKTRCGYIASVRPAQPCPYIGSPAREDRKEKVFIKDLHTSAGKIVTGIISFYSCLATVSEQAWLQ